MLKVKNIHSQADFAEFAKSAQVLEHGAVKNLTKLIEKMQRTNLQGTLVTTQTKSVEEARKSMFQIRSPKQKFHKCKKAGYLYVLVPESFTCGTTLKDSNHDGSTTYTTSPTSDDYIYHLFVQKLEDYDWLNLFAKPENKTISVKNPVGFEIIKRNIINRKYNRFAQFEIDVLLCFDNAITVHASKDTTQREANRIKKQFEELRDAYLAKLNWSCDRHSIFKEAVTHVERLNNVSYHASSPKTPTYVGINSEITKLINSMYNLTGNRFLNIPLGVYADHMDFQTMLSKADRKQYKHLKDFEADFTVMFKNLTHDSIEPDQRSAFQIAAFKARTFGEEEITKLKSRIAPITGPKSTKQCPSVLGKRKREHVCPQEQEKENALEKISAYRLSVLDAVQERYDELFEGLSDIDSRKRRRSNQ
jgi:hypothetical protein